MSAKQAVLDAALAPFAAAGLRVSVVGTHLLLHDVPVVNGQRHLQMGTLVATFIHTESSVTPPATHQVWLDGPYPCFADGRSIEVLRHSDVPEGLLAPDVSARYFFSNKDEGWTGYATHYDLLMHYWRIITDQARVIDPHCTRPFQPGAGEITVASHESPFLYPDACSARGNFSMVSERLAQDRIAIVGLGGTGSFVLDQVAKTPVREIHLFDGKDFEVHNAFRSPGGPSADSFGQKKVEHYARMYAPMRRGVIPHPTNVTQDNVELLRQFDFVFVCVDKGPARKLICEFLISSDIPFVDCGMDLSLSSEQQIYGTCRVTVCTPDKSDHFWDRVPVMEESGDGLYDQNIQVSDANALNAILAVMRWKQQLGFYAKTHDSHQMEFMLQNMAHLRTDGREGKGAN